MKKQANENNDQGCGQKAELRKRVLKKKKEDWRNIGDFLIKA